MCWSKAWKTIWLPYFKRLQFLLKGARTGRHFQHIYGINGTRKAITLQGSSTSNLFHPFPSFSLMIWLCISSQLRHPLLHLAGPPPVLWATFPRRAGLIGSADSHQLLWPFYVALLVIGQSMDKLQTPDSMPLSRQPSWVKDWSGGRFS